jgi:hypothetical protein
MPDPFINALEELLEDQLDLIDIEKSNPDYRLAENRKREIFQTLQSLPEIIETKAGAVNILALLFELRDLTGCLEGAHFDAGIKRGFSLAFKLIIHNIYQ